MKRPGPPARWRGLLCSLALAGPPAAAVQAAEVAAGLPLAQPAVIVQATPPAPLMDPTRPPPMAARPLTRAAAPAASAASATAGEAPQPVLQSVHIRAGGEGSALIDGRLVRSGDRVGDAIVTTIDPEGVTLRRETATERLLLLPAVRMTRAPGNRPSAPPLQALRAAEPAAESAPAAGAAAAAAAPAAPAEAAEPETPKRPAAVATAVRP